MGKKKPQDKQENKHFEVFVSGIPYSANEQVLKDVLCDDSSRSEVLIKLPQYQDTGRCLGYAHVECNSRQVYDNLLSMNGCSLGDRYLTIEAAKGKKQKIPKSITIPMGCKCIFVKNLPYSISEEQIAKIFQSCGEIQEIRMVFNSVTKHFKGFSYIDFKYANSTKKAITKLQNKVIQGRHILIDIVTTSHKKGYKKYNFKGSK